MRLRHLLWGPLLLAGACPIHGQEPDELPTTAVYVTGRVSDRLVGRALGFARVALVTTGPDSVVVWQGVTRENGQFEAPDIAPGEYDLRVSLLSFKTLVHPADLSTGTSRDFQVFLTPDALELEPLVVVAQRRSRMEMSGFYDRKESGVGVILERQDIEARGASRVSDLFRGMVGVRVYAPARDSQTARVRLRNDCQPQIVVDGMPFAGEIEIDQVVDSRDLEAIEVHTGMSAGVRYSSTACGTIVAWTRQLAPGEGAPLTLSRVLGAAGIVSLVLLVSR